jgi:hypothetical protein
MRFGHAALDHLRTAENDDRRVDLMTVQTTLDFLQLQLHPDRTHVGMFQKLGVLFGQPVTG